MISSQPLYFSCQTFPVSLPSLDIPFSISQYFAPDWILRTDYGLDGDSLSYEDRMERREVEEGRRAKERQLMDEGRNLWRQKKAEEAEMLFRDIEDVKEFARQKMFGK